jgi:type VI secretion system VasD/TssJ family lipoprotein
MHPGVRERDPRSARGAFSECRRLWILGATLALAAFLGGCGKKTVPAPTWSYQPDAIRFYYQADPQLNLYEGKRHTLLLAVYQLSDPSVFTNLSRDPDGVQKLLQVERFDPSVVAMERYIIVPGEQRMIEVYRAQNAKYVGLAAGYYGLSPEHSTRLFEIPVLVTHSGFLKHKSEATVENLQIQLFFGPTEINQVVPQ